MMWLFLSHALRNAIIVLCFTCLWLLMLLWFSLSCFTWFNDVWRWRWFLKMFSMLRVINIFTVFSHTNHDLWCVMMIYKVFSYPLLSVLWANHFLPPRLPTVIEYTCGVRRSRLVDENCSRSYLVYFEVHSIHFVTRLKYENTDTCNWECTRCIRIYINDNWEMWIFCRV